MDDITEVGEIKKEVMSHDEFISAIVWSANNHRGIPAKELPRKIDLRGPTTVAMSGGIVIGEKMDELLKTTAEDPQQHEWGVAATVGFSGNLEYTELIRGGKSKIVIDPEVSIFRDLKRGRIEKERRAFKIHTHGDQDVPASPQDFVSVLLSLNNGGFPATFVVTKGIKFLIIRTDKTPDDLSYNFIKKYIKNISKALDEYYDIAKWTEKDAKTSLGISMKAVRDISKKYNLAVYTSTRDNIFTVPSA